MTKWDWRYMDEDSLETYKAGMNSILGRPSEEREYYIINTEELENEPLPKKPETRGRPRKYLRCDDCKKVRLPYRPCMYCPKDDEELNAIAEDIAMDAERMEKEYSDIEHLCHQLELDAERQADIMRGK
jgi:hypothetical protein